MTSLLLLPGLDGTGELFERFVAVAPSGVSLQILPLPSDHPRTYRELADWVLEQLPAEPVALLAESFSGPLALMVANERPSIAKVVLCATFVEPPAPELLALLPSFVWRWSPPAAVLSWLMTGGDRELAKAVGRAVAGVARAVVASRINAALRVEAKAELQRLSQPLLCLHAAQDRLVRSRSTRTMRALKPSAQFAEIDGPHLLLQTRAEEAWRCIEPFLAQSSSADRH